MKTYRITVDSVLNGMRLDLALKQADLGLSRRRIRRVIDVGGVYVNRKRVRIASRTVHRGDEIRVEYNEEALKKVLHQNFELRDQDILFEGSGVVAVNKPPGLPSQATKDQSVVHLLQCLKAYYGHKGNSGPTFSLVHRLDKETSGVVLVATTKRMTAHLMDQFKKRRAQKIYLALCRGAPTEDQFEVESHLSSVDKKTGDVRSVQSGGKFAKTGFEVMARSADGQFSLLKCFPETGRTHQIRVHLDDCGLPIVGDKRYGRQKSHPLKGELADLAAVHQFLHAYQLGVPLEADAAETWITAPPPERFLKFAKACEISEGLSV